MKPSKHYFDVNLFDECTEPCLAPDAPGFPFGNCRIGSVTCTECKHCLGHGEDPKPYIICDQIELSTGQKTNQP